jgi:hypothetical protein
MHRARYGSVPLPTSPPAIISTTSIRGNNETLSNSTTASTSAAAGAVEEKDDAADTNRFRDIDELRYSLRSLEQHASFIRRIYLVTDNQVPSWLNLTNPRLTIVSHRDIFPNATHLPSFSSPAIESHLHRIPGLSKRFLYFNDDVMLGRNIHLDDFITSRGQRVFLSWDVPKCSPGCVSTWIGDGFCDKACNTTACIFDRGDCANVTATTANKYNSKYSSGGSSGSGSTYTPPVNTQCATACPITWLGDKVCDRSCNNSQCGFDATDCKLGELPKQMRGFDATSLAHHSFSMEAPYVEKQPQPAIYVNLSRIAVDFNATSTSAKYRSSRGGVLTAVLSQFYKVLVIIFRPTKDMAVSGWEGRNESFIDVAEVLVNGHLNGNTSLPFQLTINITRLFNINDAAATLDPSSLVKRDNLTTINDVTIHGDRERESSYANASLAISPHDPDTILLQHYTPSGVISSLTSSASPVPIPNGNSSAMGGGGKGKDNPSLRAPVPTLGEDDDGTRPAKRIKGKGGDTATTSATATPSDGGRKLSSPLPPLRPEATAVDGDRDFLYRLFGGYLDDALLSGETTEGEIRKLVQTLVTISGATREGEGRGGERRRLDSFADSLVHVDMLLTQLWGPEARKVPAHMPHMIDRGVMVNLIEAFKDEWEATSARRFRSGLDMQYSFAYFYWGIIHNEGKEHMDLEDVFDNFVDTNHDQWLNDNEILTLVSISKGSSPTADEMTAAFKCLKNIPSNVTLSPTLVTPPVTIESIKKCASIMKGLKSNTKIRRFEKLSTEEVGFEMLQDNINKTRTQLDGLRAKRPKFICVNDNQKTPTKEQLQLIKSFFESMWPLPSSFELSGGLVNPYLRYDDLMKSGWYGPKGGGVTVGGEEGWGGSWLSLIVALVCNWEVQVGAVFAFILFYYGGKR